MSGTKDDRYFLEVAVKMAGYAARSGYSPVGALLVDSDGNTISAFQSQRKIGNIFHAEFMVLLDHQQRLRDGHQLPTTDLTLYTVLGPCLMCTGMATVGRISKIVWLIDDLWGGALMALDTDNTYLIERMPKMIKACYADLASTVVKLWIDYLTSTGHESKVDEMLGPQVKLCK